MATRTRDALDRFRLRRHRLERRRLTEAGHHVEVQIAARRVVANGRIVAEEVSRLDLVDVRVVVVRCPKGPLQTLDVLGRGPNEDVEVLGRPHETVKAHGRGPDENVLEPLLVEGAKHSKHLVPVHVDSVARPLEGHHTGQLASTRWLSTFRRAVANPRMPCHWAAATSVSSSCPAVRLRPLRLCELRGDAPPGNPAGIRIRSPFCGAGPRGLPLTRCRPGVPSNRFGERDRVCVLAG